MMPTVGLLSTITKLNSVFLTVTKLKSVGEINIVIGQSLCFFLLSGQSLSVQEIHGLHSEAWIQVGHNVNNICI